MNVAAVKSIAKSWVDIAASSTPGFCGAHLGGSISTLPDETAFPSYRDVDISVLLLRPPETAHEHADIAYQGLMLECGYKGVDRYASPELILADPQLACHLATDSILADPTGLLGNLHRVVARDYDQRRWVMARCDAAKAHFTRLLAQHGLPLTTAVQVLWFAFQHISGLLALASLRPPTMRACLVLMQEILQQQGRTDLYEEALGVLGLSQLGRSEALAWLEQAAGAFDRVLEVRHTPSMMDYKFRAHVRPYLVEASQAMIDDGHARGAMWWIGIWLLAAYRALLLDAPQAETPYVQAMWMEFLQARGLSTPTEVASRVQQAQRVAGETAALANDLIAQRSRE